MGRKDNIEIINNIVNEVGQYIVGTVGQYSVEWDFACFVSLKNKSQKRTEFFLFHKGRPIDFKSSQLVFVLNMLFEEYKKNLYLKPEAAIKYVIRNSDLKSDIQVDAEGAQSWSTSYGSDLRIPFEQLVDKNLL